MFLRTSRESKVWQLSGLKVRRVLVCTFTALHFGLWPVWGVLMLLNGLEVFGFGVEGLRLERFRLLGMRL